MKRTLLFLLAPTLLALSAHAGTPRPASPADTADFTLEVHRIHPLAYPSQPLTAGYTLEVRGDSVFSRLPYVGRSYSATPTGGVDLDFAAPVHERHTTTGRKGERVVSFRCVNGAAAYGFRVTLWPGRRATVDVTPATAQRVGFDGERVDE